MRALLVFLGVATLVLGACVAPPPPSQRAMEAARELNLAARFGRMDLATQMTAQGARKAFLERRSRWGGDIRVLDLELAGMDMPTPHEVTIQLDVAWIRIDEDRLRTTRIAQVWSDRDGGWLLQREKRVSGDLGLFGEPDPTPREPRPDVHRPSRTIR